MGFETRQKIVECIDEIVRALRQNDYEQFRGMLARGSVMLDNLAKCCELFASLSREDLISSIDRREEADQERVLRLLTGFREFLPSMGQALGKAAEMFPKPQGGHPASLKDLESKRKLCRLILKLIAEGKSEAEAKKLAARELVANKEVEKISARTVHRIWEKRTELERQSFEEFFTQLLKSLTVKEPPTAWQSDVRPTGSTEKPSVNRDKI